MLTGPTTADLDATVAAMRAALPPELSLETNRPTTEREIGQSGSGRPSRSGMPSRLS